MITFTNLTRVDEIGANSYLLDLEGSRIVLDAGMHPKKDGNEAKPNYKLIGEAFQPLGVVFADLKIGASILSGEVFV